MSKETMKLALEGAANYIDALGGDSRKYRQALAEQPAQREPVAAEYKFDREETWGRCSIEHHNLVQSEPERWPGYKTRLLYTSPQPAQRKPLTYEQIKTRTDEQIEATFKICGGRWNGDHWVIEDADLHPFVRTIEGADLNTLRAISDEYNAWIKHHAAGHSYDDFLAKREAAHGIKGDA